MTGEYQQVYDLVLAFFNGDYEKTLLWMRTSNRLIGNMRPKDLIVLRPGKVLKFVQTSLRENAR